MYTLMIIIHVVVSLALILIVLLQTGKGAEMGAGGGHRRPTWRPGLPGPASRAPTAPRPAETCRG